MQNFRLFLLDQCSPSQKLCVMEWLFGKRKTPQEMLKENQRALNKSMRELNRESNRMEMQEKKTIADIKVGCFSSYVPNNKTELFI